MIALLLGAGFSAGTNEIDLGAGPEAQYLYPLASDLGRRCFPNRFDPAKSVEEHFAQAIEEKDSTPIKALVDILEFADHYRGRLLASDPGSDTRRLVRHFADSLYLSLNYDGLVDLALYHEQWWRPEDGFGASATALRGPMLNPPPHLDSPSRVSVLHLHGSVYLYAHEAVIEGDTSRGTAELKLLDTPKFLFDPDANSNLFMPYQRPLHGDLLYQLPWERIIAPSPTKAAALQGHYSRIAYGMAQRRLRHASGLVAVGYSFAAVDQESYGPLLDALPSGTAVQVIAPDACAICDRLGRERTTVSWRPIPMTLHAWAATDFRLGEATA